MNCDEIMELMQRYLDHDLVEVEQESLFAHLQDCSDCAASFEQLQLLSIELGSLAKVTPPFSIVDSILPRLAEIDAEAAGIEATYLTPKHRAPNRFFSWKIATGFAAAAAIISVVAVSLTPASNYDASQKMNQTMGVSNSKPDGNQPVSGATETPKSEPAAKTEPSVNGVTAQSGMASESPAITDKLQSDYSLKAKDTIGSTVQSPTPFSEKSLATGSNKSLKREANSAENKALTKDSSPEATATPDTSNHMYAMIAPGPTPAPTPGNDPPRNKQKASFAPISPTADQFKSDDGQLFGSVENQTVVISTPDQNRVYTSVFQWKANDTIILRQWLDNTRLSYQVNLEDGQIKHYIIDTIQKTEQEQ